MGQQAIQNMNPKTGENAYYLAVDMKDPKNLIGEGQSSKIYKVRRCHDGKVVCVKVFKLKESDMDDEDKNVVKREIAVLRSLEPHPLIV